MDVKDIIIQYLDGKDGITLLELNAHLKEAKAIIDWFELKTLLIEMEKEQLIEERHFENGKVDYILDIKGQEQRHP